MQRLLIEGKRVLRTLGNGDLQRGVALLGEIADRLDYARQKHVWCGATRAYGASAVVGEAEELWDAGAHGEGPEREHSEALDVLATAVRYANREWEDGK